MVGLVLLVVLPRRRFAKDNAEMANNQERTLREELENLDSSPNPDEWCHAVRQLLDILNNDEHLDEEWEPFATHFDKVHADFLARLRDRYPQLTPRDHKLCAFLRMNLSSKEIAPLLYISVRDVEISRCGLRKKLDLDDEANLTDFLLGILGEE
ncbi:MAG: hypothetical protein SGJ02_08220 [bacterium]|nr:hypothetical protein [bacterium]